LPVPLIDELADADAQPFAMPLCDIGSSQHSNTCLDLVIADPRMVPGVDPVTATKSGLQGLHCFVCMPTKPVLGS
jgi:FMN-dependent NADH-azoreductase